MARCTTTPTQLVTAADLAPASLGSVGVANPFLAVDATGIFYNLTYTGANGAADPTGHLAFVPFGGAPRILGNAVHPGRFVVTPDRVIFVDDDGLHSVPRDQGASVLLLAPATSASPWLASDGQRLFFDDTSGIVRVPISGGTPQPVASADGFSAGLIGGDLVVADFTGGTVSRVSTTTGAITQLATGQGGPLYPLACGASATCWIDAGDLAHTTGTLMRLDASGTATVVATDSQLWHAHALATDGAHFFVMSDAGGGTLARVDAATGAVDVLENLTTHLHGDGDVVVDDQCIYYSSFDGIFSLAKDAAAL